MARIWRVGIALGLLAGLALGRGGMAPVRGEGPQVGLFLFYLPECGACHIALDELIPSLEKRHPGMLSVKTFDLNLPENLRLLQEFERARGVRVQYVPTVVIGERVLQGQEVFDELPRLVAEALAEGGLDFPAPSVQASPPPEVATKDKGAVPPPIHLAYFHQAGCRECDLVQPTLEDLKREFPQLVVHAFDIGEPEAKALCEVLCEEAQVPEGERLTAPAVFIRGVIGGDALRGEKLTAENLRELVLKYRATGTPPIGEETIAQGTQAILQRFRSFSAFTVVAAGLIDGLNPCAFATLAFLVGYLRLSHHRRGEIFLAGMAFTLGVLLTYFLTGLGIFKLVERLDSVSGLAGGVYLATAAACLILGGLSLYDWWQARRGRVEAIRLKLPKALQELSRKLLREGTRWQAYLPVAFGLGLAISALEFACTGQVYLPTIVFVVGRPELRARALAYLALYNLLFVAPLVVVFTLAYFGTTSERLLSFTRRNLASAKLGTGLLFLALGAWLLLA